MGVSEGYNPFVGVPTIWDAVTRVLWKLWDAAAINSQTSKVDCGSWHIGPILTSIYNHLQHRIPPGASKP